jgi:hypothetical protein
LRPERWGLTAGSREVPGRKPVTRDNNNMDGTTRKLNFMKQVGVTVLVEKQIKGQDMADDSSSLSDTHR